MTKLPRADVAVCALQAIGSTGTIEYREGFVEITIERGSVTVKTMCAPYDADIATDVYRIRDALLNLQHVPNE